MPYNKIYIWTVLIVSFILQNKIAIAQSTPTTQHRKPIASIELKASYDLNFYGHPNKLWYMGYGVHSHYYLSHGIGLSAFPEFKYTNRFSLITGVSAECIFLKDYNYSDGGESGITIPKGYETRIYIPIWLRFTFDTRVPVFFQVGISGGANLYSGQGTSYRYGISGSDTHNGLISMNAGSFTPFWSGIGIRKEIIPGVQIITSVDASIFNFEVNSAVVYQPYLQFHLGVNLNPQKIKSKEQ
jgi:hypothetical protein